MAWLSSVDANNTIVVQTNSFWQRYFFSGDG